MSGGMSFELTRGSGADPASPSPSWRASSTTTTGWRRTSAHEFPQEFYDAIAKGGWLGMTIPEEYGGHGLGITEATMLARGGRALRRAR